MKTLFQTLTLSILCSVSAFAAGDSFTVSVFRVTDSIYAKDHLYFIVKNMTLNPGVSTISQCANDAPSDCINYRIHYDGDAVSLNIRSQDQGVSIEKKYTNDTFEEDEMTGLKFFITRNHPSMPSKNIIDVTDKKDS